MLTACQRIFEDLLKAEEFEDGEVDGRVEAEAALVWPKSRIELNTEATIDLTLALVVVPYHPELDDSLGYSRDSEGLAVFRVLLEEGRVLECR